MTILHSAHGVHSCVCIVVRTNIRHFPIQHELIGFYNRGECVYAVVRTGYLNIAQVNFQSRASPYDFLVDKVALGRVFTENFSFRLSI